MCDYYKHLENEAILKGKKMKYKPSKMPPLSNKHYWWLVSSIG